MKIQLVPKKYKFVSHRQRCTGNAVETHLYHLRATYEPGWVIRVTESRGTHYEVGSGVFSSKHYRMSSLSNIRHKEDNRLRAQRRRRARISPSMIHVRVQIKRGHQCDDDEGRGNKRRKVRSSLVPNRKFYIFFCTSSKTIKYFTRGYSIYY